MDIVSSMPLSLHENCARLLKARKSNRPADTLPFTAQCLLHWQVIAIGVPSFSKDSLGSMARDFRSIGCDTAPIKLPKWSPDQTGLASEVLGDLWLWLMQMEPLPLPEWETKPAEGDYPLLLNWIWNHVDFHFMALTMGLMGTGLLTDNPKDPRHKDQKPFLEFMMQTFGILVPLADDLGKESKKRMPVNEALEFSSTLLDSMAGALDDFFRSFGPQGLLLARSGGWYRPAYPCTLKDFAREKTPPKPRKKKAQTQP